MGVRIFFFFFFFLILAVLDLCCCVEFFFSSCSKRHLLCSCVGQASDGSGFSCEPRVSGHTDSVVVAAKLWSTGSIVVVH